MRRGSLLHLGIKLLILQHKSFIIFKYTPIYTPNELAHETFSIFGRR